MDEQQNAERRDEKKSMEMAHRECKIKRAIKSLPNCPLSSNKRTHLCIIKSIYLNDIELEIAFALPFKLYSTINYGAQ